MNKLVAIVILICILTTQTGCDFCCWLSANNFSSQVNKTELEKQKDERIIEQFKDMMMEEE